MGGAKLPDREPQNEWRSAFEIIGQFLVVGLAGASKRKIRPTTARWWRVMSTRAVFADAQPIYAEHGIATFPVTELKAPAVRGYLKMGLADW